MKRLSIAQQIEALDNALRSFGINKKYFIHCSAPLFAIAQKSEYGGINIATGFMKYDVMNAYIKGYNDCQTNKL